MTTWPEDCPTCHGAWAVRSKTMGAAMGQPHRGTCVNGHHWSEGQQPLPADDAVVHMAPQGHDPVMPCCRQYPTEHMADRMTNDPDLVTCTGLDRVTERPTIELRLLPPGQLLVATLPDRDWDPDAAEQAADQLDRARAAMGMPEGASIVLLGGITLQTMTDEQLAQVGLLRHVSQVNEDRIKAAAVQLHRNRYRIEQGASEPTPDEGGQLSVMWSNVAREVLRAYLGIDPL
ncbi:MAG: hypothetical protein SHS37scaffold145_65 [Phage 71_18]|nr:MAG: hypothetical protein SHS37scaffold145_65 [Phage 71_18]